MIAVLFVKDVDERAFADGERVLRPEDAFEMAVWLFELAEQRKLSPGLQARVGVDVELPRWQDQSAETQWAFFHRALQAIQETEAQRRRPVGAVLDPAQPAGEL